MNIVSGYPTGALSRDEYIADYGKAIQKGKAINKWGKQYPERDKGKKVIGKINGFKIYKDADDSLFYYYAGNRINANSIEEIERRFNSKFIDRNNEPEWVVSESLVTSEVTVDIPVSKEPIAEYIRRITQAIRSEQEAIREYQMILDLNSLPQNVKNAVSEIMEDEKDHMVILAALTSLEIDETFPKNGDINPETGLEEDKPKAEESDKEVKAESSKLKRKKLHKINTDKLTEAIEATKISMDGINNTVTYKVVADVNYDEDFILRAKTSIDNNIQELGSEYDMNIQLISFGAGKLTYKITVDKDEDFDEAEVTERVIGNNNKYVWL